MAIRLTTNWQNIASAIYEPGTGFKAGFYLDAKYSEQSTINNNTKVQTRLTSYVFSGSGGGYGYEFWCTYVTQNVSGSGYWNIQTETIMNAESIVRHEEDGTKIVNIGAVANVYGLGMYLSMNGDIELPPIDRYPMIVQSPDFSDEDDPTITYTTSLGFSGASVEAGIFSSDGNTAYADYRAVNVADGSYTFHLTSSERNSLRNSTPDNNNMNVMFKLRTTTTNNEEYFSTSIKTLTIVNAQPTFTYSMSEINSNVSALLGSSADTIVQNASVVRFVVSPTALKGSSISKVEVIHNNQSYPDTTSPYEIDVPVTDNSFAIRVTDSRNNIKITALTKTLIEYQPVDITSLTMKRQNPTSSNIILNLNAKYYQKTFGSTANVPIVKWKLNDGSYTTIPSSNYVIDTTNDKLTISNYVLSNALVYTSPGTFTVEISDLLTSDTDARDVIKGIATFDVGEHDLQVNGDLYVADTSRNNAKNILNEIDGRVKSYNLVTDGSEVKVGYKVDGKDVYAKRYGFSSLTNGTQLAHGLSNFTLIDWDGMTLYQGTWRKLPYPLSNGYYVFNVDSTYISYYTSTSLIGMSGEITLYYIYNS